MSERTTVLYGDEATAIDGAIADGANLWLRLDDLTRTSGWQLKPEGACLDDMCVPVPSDRRERFVRGDGGDTRFNLAELARTLGMPVVADATTGTWCFGESPADSAARMLSLQAPDFTLPDIDGRMHSLSDFRGRKVFLLAWASW